MINKVGKKTIYIICSIVFLILFLCSIFPVDVGKWTVNLEGYGWLYILLFLLLTLFLYLFIKITERIKNKKIINIIYLVLIFVIPIILLNVFSSVLVADGKEVFDFVLESLAGDYHKVFKGYYMSIYPWQYGLSLFQSIILKVTSIFNENILYNRSLCVDILSYVNTLLTSLTILCGYLITKTISNDDSVVKSTYIFISLTCLPFFMYSLFIYSDVPSICFSIIALYLFILFLKTKKWRFSILSVMFICFATMIRFSAIIFAIAFALVILYNSLFESKNIKYIFVSILFIVIPVLTNKIPTKYYEMASNYKQMVNEDEHRIDDGCPTLLNVAMGINVNSREYGWFDGESLHVCIDECNQDVNCQNKIAKQKIQTSLNTMISDLPLTLNFFSHKIASEWGDGTMGVLQETDYVKNNINRKIVNVIYTGKGNVVINCYAKAHLILVYTLTLFFVVKKRKIEKFSMIDYVLEIIVLGGFILSIFWEAKSRYNLPYLYIMVIIASINSKNIYQLIQNRKSVKNE